MSDVLYIDLFEDKELMGKISSYNKQMETRGYALDTPISSLEEIKGYGDEFEAYKNDLIRLTNVEREYRPIPLTPALSEDNLFDLECLGVGKYCKKYTCIIDMSNHLDLVLNILCGCNMDNIRNIPDYNRYSKAILSGCTEDISDLRVGELFNSDDKINEYLVKIEQDNFTEDELFNVNASIARKVLRIFYANVISTSYSIKEYILYAMKKSTEEYKDIVYRSKNRYCSLFTSSNEVNHTIIVNNYDSTTGMSLGSKPIEIKSYTRMQYATEKGLQYEYSR